MPDQSDVCYVVVSTWGNPSSWKDVEYVLSGTSVISCCSSIPLIKHLVNSHGVDLITHIFILGLDSVIDVNTRLGSGVDSCGKVFHKCYNDLRDKSINNYDEILEKALNLYECVFTELFSQVLDKHTLSKLLEKTRIIILPAIGSPGGSWRFSGDPRDYFSKALIDMGIYVLKSLSQACRSIVIVFDSTHGINYMPTLTLKLIEILAQLLWLRYEINVKIEVYNSDPYSPRAIDHRLNLNKVYEKVISEVEIPYVKEVKSHALLKTSAPYMSKEHMDILSNIVKKLIRNATSSLYSPAPLPLLYACYEYLEDLAKVALDIEIKSRDKLDRDVLIRADDSFDHVLSEIVEKWKSSISIEERTVSRALAINGNVVWALLVVGATCRYVYDLIMRDQDVVKTIGERPVFKLESLKQLSEHIYSRVHSAMKYLINHELGKIEELVKNISRQQVITNKCVEYKALISSYRDKNGGKESDNPFIQERVLIAHAGLPYDLVDICIHDDRIYLGYRDKGVVKNVYECLKRVFDKRFASGDQVL